MKEENYSPHEFLKEELSDRKEKYSFTLLIFLIIMLIGISTSSYVMFHSFSEIICIVISLSVSLIAINTYDISHNGFFMFLGISFLFMNFFASMHVFSINGLNVFSGNADNITVQYHTIARFVESISLLISFRFFDKKVNYYKVFGIYFFISVCAFLSIGYFNNFPTMYITSQGPTHLKILSQCLIIIIYACSIYELNKHKKRFYPKVFFMLIASIINNIIAELIFFNFRSLYDTQHVIGHCFRLIACFYMYKAICETTLKKPYKTLFYGLTNATDNLIKENCERKAIEAKLRESEELYRQVTELSPEAIIIHNDFIISYANSYAFKLLGEDNEKDLIGKSLLDYVHSDYKEIAKNRVISAQISGKVGEFIDEIFVKKDGTEIYVEATVNAFPHNNMVLSIIRDITAKKQAEASEKLLKEALAYDNLKTEFFANISHEFRTPLNVIFGAVQLIELYNKQSCFDSNTDKYTKIMKQNCYRLLRLVNNLIDITRIDSGFYQLNQQNLDIVNLLEDITQSVVQYAENKSIELIFDTDVEEKVMAFDPDKLERIILNLLSNSIKFTKENGKILVSFYDKGDKVLITVEDTGIGIPEEKIDYIFERFRQVDKSLTRDYEGSGIGLSLVKSLVEMHNGTIHVSSIPDEGSKFTIDLPVTLVQENQKVINLGKESIIETINIEFSDIYS